MVTAIWCLAWLEMAIGRARWPCEQRFAPRNDMQSSRKTLDNYGVCGGPAVILMVPPLTLTKEVSP